MVGTGDESIDQSTCVQYDSTQHAGLFIGIVRDYRTTQAAGIKVEEYEVIYIGM